jgi:hypothetical protein
MIMTFGVGWWVGRVHPPRDQESSVARTMRTPVRAARRDADVAPAILTIATIPQAPAVLPGSSLAPARMVAVAPVAPDTLLASEKPTDTVALVFVPTEL